MKRLANKVALITGGSRGIGAAITRRLAAEGANVVLTYTKSAEKAAAIANDINQSGGKALAIRADNADPQAVTDAVNKAISHFGGIDILVNNAGMYIGKPFDEHTLEDYQQIMAVNVQAVYVAALAASKNLKEGGRIITIGSNMADNAVAQQSTLYAMSKSALSGFTRGLARDLGPRGITVNLIQPGPVDTDMNPADAPLADLMRARMALSQYGTGDDIAALAAHLAGDEGKYITGTAITIDGGFNA